MSTFPVLEFKISRQQEGVYSIALSYDLPGSAAEIRMGQSQPAIMHLNLAELSFQVQDSQIYAQTLSTSFFSDINVRLFFEKALVNANTLSLPLRVRLLIDASAPELHSVRWELLSNPKDGSALFLGENLYFSRYLESADWRAVRLHERRQLRALVVVSNPDNLDRYPGMAPVDVGGEVDRARQGLGDITPSVLGQNEPASLENLATRLRAEKPDILYISAHGALIQNEPYLWLQDPSGQAAVTSGQDLADRLQELTAPPLLVLLASCQSAGQESAADARSALGPRLAEVGVPAVIAMQGDITQTTLAEFMPTFYAALQEDGQVDYAVALARGHVRQRLDFWMPVLYLRLRDGRLWVEAEERPPTAEDRIATAIGDYHQDFLPRAKRQSEGFMRANQGTAGHPGVFIPAIYVHRRQVESQLESFLYSQEPAAILTGAPGVGKTSLLCHWAQGLLEAEQSVFIYNCATFLNSEVENYLLEDLSLTNREDLFPALNHIAGNARASEKQFVIIFDNLNDYRGSFDQKTGPYELLRKIDALVRNPNFPASAVRFLISCSTPTWSYLEKQDARFLEWAYRPPYYQPEEDQVINLAVFSDEELKAAYEAYKNYFELQSPFDALPEAIRQRMRTPDLLRMLAETYQSRPEPIAYEAQALSIFRRYYEQRVRRLQDKVLLKKLVVEMYNQKRVSLPLIDLASLDHFREELLSDDWNTSYKRLLEVGVLTETKSPFTGDTVSFTHSRFGAFALALHLGNQGPITETVLLGLVDESSDFPMVWDAAITMLLMGKDTSLFLDAAKSRNVALRELVVQALVELHADEPDNSLEMIQSLIDSSSMEAQRSGLKAAYWIGPGAREIYLWAASKGSDELRSAAKEILYLIWRQDPDFTYSLLDELANRLGPRALT
jgi:hypothetical protein